jgi:hypothetical protein
MFQRELLMLRKTFIKLLNKNFIHINNFAAAASVLFAKKLKKGLYFYVNY